MQPWTKEIITKAIKASKPIRFVDTIEEVANLVNQKIYGIEKDSPALKELIQEGIFPVDTRFLPFLQGFYYIIDIRKKEIEIKSEVKTEYIAYTIHRKTENEKYWKSVYQNIITPLVETIQNPESLVGRMIYIENIIKNENTKINQIIWYDVETRQEMKSEVYAELEAEEEYNREMQEQIQFELEVQEAEFDEIKSFAEIEEEMRLFEDDEQRMYAEMEEEAYQAEENEQRMYAEMEAEIDNVMNEAITEAQMEFDSQDIPDDSWVDETPDEEHYPE